MLPASEELQEGSKLAVLSIVLCERLPSEDYKMLAINADSGAYFIVKWDQRQFKSNFSAERTRRWRAEKKRKAVTSQVRHTQRHGDALDTEEESETETESESEVEAVAEAELEADNLYGGLLTAFINSSKLPILGNLKPRDNEALLRMVAAGCTPADVEAAVIYNGRMTCGGPIELDTFYGFLREVTGRIFVNARVLMLTMLFHHGGKLVLRLR